MSVFVDTGVLVAFANSRDDRHQDATRILDAARGRRWGRIITSDYILDEAVTLLLARTKRPERAVRLGQFILGTGDGDRVMDLAFVDPRSFLRAWVLFARMASRGLSFTDCTSLELMRALRIDRIASFDRGFDGIVPRMSSVEE